MAEKKASTSDWMSSSSPSRPLTEKPAAIDPMTPVMVHNSAELKWFSPPAPKAPPFLISSAKKNTVPSNPPNTIVVRVTPREAISECAGASTRPAALPTCSAGLETHASEYMGSATHMPSFGSIFWVQ